MTDLSAGRRGEERPEGREGGGAAADGRGGEAHSTACSCVASLGTVREVACRRSADLDFDLDVDVANSASMHTTNEARRFRLSLFRFHEDSSMEWNY